MGLTWTLAGTATGANVPVSISNLLSTAREFLVIVAIDGGGNKESIHIPRAEISGNSWFRAGGYTSIATPVLVTILVNTSVSLVNASLASTDYSSTSVIRVYYR